MPPSGRSHGSRVRRGLARVRSIRSKRVAPATQAHKVAADDIARMGGRSSRRTIAHARVTRVRARATIGAVANEETLHVIVLAAGRSSRMRFPKALAEIGGELALARVLHI